MARLPLASVAVRSLRSRVHGKVGRPLLASLACARRWSFLPPFSRSRRAPKPQGCEKEVLDEGTIARGQLAADGAVGAVFLGYAAAKVIGLRGARLGPVRAPPGRGRGVLSLSGRGDCFLFEGSRHGLERWVGDDEGALEPGRERRVV